MLSRALIALAAMLLLACGGSGPTQEPAPTPEPVQEEIVKEVVKEVVKEGQLLVLPFDGRETLEERTLSSAVIARVELASHRIVGARYSTFRDDYAPAIEFTFDVLEYLKGTGGATVTAWAFGVDMWNRHYADTPEEAKKKSWMLEQYRDTRWDDRQAIVFLQQPVVGEPYLLGYIGWRRTSRSNGSVEVTNTVTVSDDERQAWLPATTSAGASTRGVTGRSPEQHFFLEDPGATTTATTRSAPRGAATSPSGTAPTISKSSLKAKIAEIENGITSDAYRECVLGKHRVVRYARYLEASGKRFGLTFEHDLRSGAAAGTEAIYPHRFMSRSDSIGREWLVGPDKDLFTARQERVYSTRPLPQGEYKVFYNWRPVGWVDCPPYPKEALEYDEFRVTVVAPGGTLAESFFDPYADGAAVTGTTTVGTVSWQLPSAGSGQAGRVTADLTIDVTGHALDFIGLDGTTTLSLDVADATETTGALTWAVPSQPWRAGDKLMLRIRRHNAPVPTPTSAP